MSGSATGSNGWQVSLPGKENNSQLDIKNISIGIYFLNNSYITQNKGRIFAT